MQLVQSLAEIADCILGKEDEKKDDAARAEEGDDDGNEEDSDDQEEVSDDHHSEDNDDEDTSDKDDDDNDDKNDDDNMSGGNNDDNNDDTSDDKDDEEEEDNEDEEEDNDEENFSTNEMNGMTKKSVIHEYRNEMFLEMAILDAKPIAGMVQLSTDAWGVKAFEFQVVFRKPVRQHARRKVIFNDKEGVYRHGLWCAPLEV